jgi:sigma-E factor negative regulatory protein RseC
MLVNVVSQSACASCHAKGACNSSDFEDKEIEVTGFNKSYSPGEVVTVVFKQTQGYAAVFWGYGMPFIVVLFTLIIANLLSVSELLSGLISLGVLVPYYIILYFFRNTFKKVFKFEVEENI